MQYVKSCGAVVFTRCDEENYYVIIRQINGDCGFPKGHMEAGETEQDTALREIREEVGLNVRLLEGFRREVIYPFPKRPDIIKQSVYFLAEYSGQETCCQPSEVSDTYLLPFDKAVDMLSFPETKQILFEANQFLNQR